MASDVARNLLSQIEQLLQENSDPCLVSKPSWLSWLSGHKSVFQVRNSSSRQALQAWLTISRQVMRQDHPFQLHQLLHKQVFQDWDRSQVRLQPTLWLFLSNLCTWNYIFTDGKAIQHVLQGPAPVWVPSDNGKQDTNLAQFMQTWQVSSVKIRSCILQSESAVCTLECMPSDFLYMGLGKDSPLLKPEGAWAFCPQVLLGVVLRRRCYVGRQKHSKATSRMFKAAMSDALPSP